MYAVIFYADKQDDDKFVKIIHVVDDCDIAKKLAFHYAKCDLPTEYSIYKYRIVQDYSTGEEQLYMENEVIIDYRIAQIECGDYGEDEIIDVYNNVWAVIKFNNNDIPDVEPIDEHFIFQ